MRTILLSVLLLSVLLTSCVPLATLTAEQNPYQLPLVRGVVSYQQTIVKNGIKPDEFYQAARSWFQQNKRLYALEREKPIYRTTLLQSAIIPTTRILHNRANNYSYRTVHYLITIDAKDDSCRILLSNFDVYGINGSKYGVEIEKLASDKELCESINREGWAVVESLRQHILKNVEKPS